MERALLWWLLVVFAHLDQATLPNLSPLIPIAAGLLWAGLAYVTIRRLSSAADWRDVHRLALIFGASLARMIGGTLSVVGATPVDRLGKLVVDLIAIALLAIMASRLRRRGPSVQRSVLPEAPDEQSAIGGRDVRPLPPLGVGSLRRASRGYPAPCA